jgi:hypothetical protein
MALVWAARSRRYMHDAALLNSILSLTERVGVSKESGTWLAFCIGILHMHDASYELEEGGGGVCTVKRLG